MPESKTVTGHTVVMAKLADGGEAIVRRGETLPEGLASGEQARLEKAGAFDPAPTASLAGQGARPAFAEVPQITYVDQTLPPRGDLANLALPPQVTLQANTDAEGFKAKGVESDRKAKA